MSHLLQKVFPDHSSSKKSLSPSDSWHSSYVAFSRNIILSSFYCYLTLKLLLLFFFFFFYASGLPEIRDHGSYCFVFPTIPTIPYNTCALHIVKHSFMYYLSVQHLCTKLCANEWEAKCLMWSKNWIILFLITQHLSFSFQIFSFLTLSGNFYIGKFKLQIFSTGFNYKMVVILKYEWYSKNNFF